MMRPRVLILLLGATVGAAGASWAGTELAATPTRVIWERAKELLPLPADTKAWEMEPAPLWPGRSNHGAVVLGDDLWIYGGLNSSRLNDVWHTRNASTWTRAIASAAWSPRIEFGAVAFLDKMWVLGGNDAVANRNDVYSSTDGVNWTEVTDKAQWSERYTHASVVHNDLVWVLGGYSGAYLNDVWYSADGKDWTMATANAAWGPRAHPAAAVFQNQLWICGGQFGNTRYRDVWHSDDGILWIQATSTAPWSARGGHSLTVFENRLWLMGGGETAASKELWYSGDGTNWFEGEIPDWKERYGHRAAVFSEKLYILGGYTEPGGYSNEVWSYDSGSAMGCGAGSARSGAGLPRGDLLALTAVMLVLAAARKAGVSQKQNAIKHSLCIRGDKGTDDAYAT